MPHYVYKYVYNDEIIYIGKTDSDLKQRLSQHGKTGDNIDREAWNEINSSEIYYITLANSTMCDVVESELIRRYKPKYNKAKMTDWSGLPFEEPQWKTYRNDYNDLKIDYEILKNKYNLLKKEYEEYQQKIANEKESEKKRELNNHITRLILDNYYDETSVATDKNISGVTFDEILSEYKNTDNPIAYVSKAFDEKKNLICEKIIHTNGYDHLEFLFYQYGCVEKRGMIYRTRCDETKTNHQVLRNWINRGNNLYRHFSIEDMPLLFQSKTREILGVEKYD